MNGGVTFLASPAELAMAAAAAALAVWVVAALLGRPRIGDRRAGLHLGLLAVALLALVALQARLARPAALAPAAAVLLTPGATAADLAAAVAGGGRVWAIPGRPGEPAPAAGATLLPDAASLARNHPEVDRLRIVGHGLTAAEWAALPLHAEAATPPPLPLGASRVAWERQLPLGATLEVRGEVANVPEGGATLSLEGAGIAGAMLRIAAGQRAPFTLRGLPRAAGRHLLTLRLAAVGRESVAETLEVAVMPAAPPAVLWLEAAPSLESRELAHWLGAAGGVLAVRSQLSRGIVREQLTGLSDGPALAPLNPALLTRFDLVVADGRTLAALGAAERAALRQAVEEGSAGLLVRPEADSGATPTALDQRFALRPIRGTTQLAARLRWPQLGEMPELALPPREIAPEGALVPLATDRAGRLLAAWRPAGTGVVGVTLVDGTWRWVREGNAAAHRRYWHEVLRVLARPAPPGPRWRAAPGPALAGRPLELTLETEEQDPAATIAAPSGASFAPGLRQDRHEPRRWATTLWPRDSGWHRAGDGPGALWLWAAPAESWVTLRLAERQAATAEHLLATTAPATTPQPPAERLAPLPRWPWFALFLAALGLLWLDEAWRRHAAPSAAA